MRVRSLVTGRSLNGASLAAVLSAALAACGLSAIAIAPAPSMAQSAAPSAKQDPADARKDVISGVKAFEKGRMDEAIALLTKGLKSGGLPPADTAKALYYRGLANRRSGRPAQAISDLTSSVWLKDGLNEDERKTALENRSAAYAEAGLKDPGMADMAAGGGASGPAKTASKSGPANPGASSTYSSSESSGGALSGVGNFFSGWFGGGSSSAQASTDASAGQSEPVRSAAAPSPSASPSAPPSASVSAWNSTTQKTAAKGGSGGQWETASTQPTKAAPAPAASVAQTKPVKGRFEVHVAAVRSRDEAERLAHELTRKHGNVLGSRVADIEETVFGNMGTFYRVSIGPFAKAADTSGLCKELKASGYDCMVAKN